jgi:hypothetical protein
LGTGDKQDRITPVEVQIHSDVASTTKVSACAAGDQFSACVWGVGGDEGGLLYTWGSNIYGTTCGRIHCNVKYIDMYVAL